MKDIDKNFISFIKEIKTKILSFQYEALKKVNKELISLYWDIEKISYKSKNNLARAYK